MITTENIKNHEFIGMNTQIVKSSNPQIIGLNGGIVDETKSMFKINTEKGIKSIAKANNTWKFSIGDSEIEIDGTSIQKRPFDRIGGKK